MAHLAADRSVRDGRDRHRGLAWLRLAAVGRLPVPRGAAGRPERARGRRIARRAGLVAATLVSPSSRMAPGRHKCRPYDRDMSTVELRRDIKKAIDQLPRERLALLADYVHFLARPPLEKRLAEAR